MKIEVVLNQEYRRHNGALFLGEFTQAHHLKGSIIWEPVANPLVWWWLEQYVTKEFYKTPVEPSIFHPSHKIAHITDNEEYRMEERMALKKQTTYLRDLINKINSMVDDPANYLPVKPEEINLKINDESRQVLNRIHRVFVQTSQNRGRRQDTCMDYWTNWGELKPGDFPLRQEVHEDFYKTVELLNYGCHDIEYYYYYRSKRAKNMPDYPEVLMEHVISEDHRDKFADYSDIGPCTPEAHERVKMGRRLMVSSPLIPEDMYQHQSSDNNIDVWMPQNCILGKSPTLCYLDDDNPKYSDINNGHQVNNFGFSFTERRDRKFLKQIGFAGKMPYGFPLGRIVEGKPYVDFLNSNLANKTTESMTLVKDILIHDSTF